MTTQTTKREIHDASGTFFLREEGPDFIYWKLARYSCSVSDEKAVEDIKRNGYMRKTDENGNRTYIRVASLLMSDVRREVAQKINAHMGIKI